MAFPDRLEDVKRLVEQHRQLEHQTLLLAVYFNRPEDPDSVYLLEVISQLGYDEVSDDNELFEMSYGSTEGFRVPIGSRLNIILTNAVELRVAIEKQWDSLRSLLAAVELGPEQYQVIFSTGVGDDLISLLRQELVAA